MKNYLDGGEAILEGLRALGIDYVTSSPGSEWGALWEAFARQTVNGTPGPTYLTCAHETLAVDLAIGYTLMTGRMQAVVLHTGVGLLQGAIGIDGAQRMGVPMVVLSGEALTFGERSDFDPGHQWTTSLSVVGGPDRLAAPLVKWSSPITSLPTLYETIVRGGELAQRNPTGPVYLSVPIEVMLEAWTPPEPRRKVPPVVPPQAPMSEIERVAGLLLAAKNPVITTESAGRSAQGYHALLELAELLAIPVCETGPADSANFPKDHPLHQGFSMEPYLDAADLVLVVRSRVPWYPPAKRPKGTVVSIDEQPLRGSMVYQNLQADIFLEGDVVHTLKTLAAAARAAKPAAAALDERRERAAAQHRRAFESYRAPAANGDAIHPATLCETMGKVLPKDAIYIDETITHRAYTLRNLVHQGPQSFYRGGGGLGQGLGVALGAKLAARDRLVVSVIGDGSFLYNPIVQSLALSKHADLPILIVIFNNNGYQAMKREHQAYYPDGVAQAKDIFYGMPTTDFEYSELVRPFGGYGERVEKPAQLAPALTRGAEAVREGKTAILNVMLDR